MKNQKKKYVKTLNSKKQETRKKRVNPKNPKKWKHNRVFNFFLEAQLCFQQLKHIWVSRRSIVCFFRACAS